MTHTNPAPHSAPRKSWILAAVSAVALTTAMFSATSSSAQVHAPLNRVDGPAVVVPDLLGEPQGSDIAAALEAIIIDDYIDETFGKRVSPGAKLGARQAYAQGVFAPLWTRSSAEQLMRINETSKDNGFNSGYNDEELRAAIDQRFSGSAEQRAHADLKLTATWLVLASKLSGGLSDEGGMVESTDTRPTRSDLIVALRKAGQNDPIKAMEEFASTAPQYSELKNALKKYRMHADNGGWMRIREGDEMLEPGMHDPRVVALRKRLASEDFAEPTVYQRGRGPVKLRFVNDPTLYDEDLVDAAKTFQAAHGLMQDGLLGTSTLAALNESVSSKVGKIEQAMAHWRRQDDLGSRYIWVNIPTYRAEAWTGDRRDVSMKTIVGKSRTPSTAFSDEIEYVVVNPKWYLPIGLFKRQKLRKLRKNPGYAAAHHYEIFDRASGAKVDPYNIDWDEPGIARKIQMVQTAGKHNALGQLKIIFPNRHSIYLHDTPSRHLFDRDVRALSSGCIRLDDPVEMANWLTDGDTAISTDVFNATLESGGQDRFYLDKHVNVHLTYLPAVVSPEGQIEFPADIYREFKKPTLAQDTYSDNIEGSDNDDRYVKVIYGNGPRTKVLH